MMSRSACPYILGSGLEDGVTGSDRPPPRAAAAVLGVEVPLGVGVDGLSWSNEPPRLCSPWGGNNNYYRNCGIIFISDIFLTIFFFSFPNYVI